MPSPIPPGKAGDPPEAVLIAERVVRRFGSRAVVDGISLEVGRGSIHLIVGANGSGKTTIGRLLVGLLRPHGGRIQVFGGDPKTNGEVRRRIGYLGHESQLYGDLSAVENLRFAARIHGRHVAVDELERRLESFAVAHARGVAIQRLSRGTIQKIALIKAMLHEPTLLVLDEPLTGLDAASVERTIQVVKTHADRGGAAIVVSHDLGHLWRLPATVHLVDYGQIRHRTTTAEPLENFRRTMDEFCP